MCPSPPPPPQSAYNIGHSVWHVCIGKYNMSAQPATASIPFVVHNIVLLIKNQATGNIQKFSCIFFD